VSLNRKLHIAPQFRRIAIVGVGGTGSYLAQGLAKLVAGYQLQVGVTLVDPDQVEEKNCSRQNFHVYEIGQPKAEALAFRLNQRYGLSFAAVVGKGEEFLGYNNNGTRNGNSATAVGKRCPDMGRLVITCVDTVEARRPYRECGPWLDLGNGVETGQALYGITAEKEAVALELQTWDSTPQVGSLPNPYLLAGMAKLKSPRKKAPSCADTPFAEQGFFANEWAATAGLAILHQLLVKGQLTTPAIYFDTSSGRMSPQLITKEYLQGV
jgi:PRTRC genetic system ThiF family protein